MEDNKRARVEDVNRLRKLLARAPADRAWCRRGLLILCRAFPGKARLESDNYPAVGGGSMEQTDSVSGHNRADKRATARENGVDKVIDDADTAERAGTSIEDTCGSLCNVEARAVALE